MKITRLDISVGLLLAITFLIGFLSKRIEDPIYFGVHINWIAYLTMSVAFSLGGFYSLRGLKNGINKAVNIAMMIVFFTGGLSLVIISIWRIYTDFSK